MATEKMEESAWQPSLIPYLDKRQGVKLSLLSGGPDQLKSAYPFSVLQDSHPFARLLKADFVTDAGSVVRRMFMLVERDAYRFTEDELFPLANPDLERCWQETSKLIGSGSKEVESIFLAGQLDEDENLLAFSSLFFCRARKSFFHPPCPVCGEPLQLCRDDELLRKHGLSSWSRSLKRYLNCPTCVGEEDPRFFAYELEPNDPPFLMDRWGLIREFGRLHENRRSDNPFPCVNCSQWGSCYGQGQASQSRIVPFSFYPFHILLCEAASFHAMDFLALLSGATLEELTVELESRGESGRISCLANWEGLGEISGFLYRREDEAHFLEVLYLKLSLLLDAFRKTVSAAPEQGQMQLGPRIVGLWVDLPGSIGTLPWLWSFRTRFVDLLKPEPDLPAMGDQTSGASPFYMGIFWFQALARNRNRSGREIVEQLKRLGTELVREGGALADEEWLRLFPPGNIFWSPDDRKVPSKFHGHWKSLIRLGAELIAAGIAGSKEFPDDRFFKRAEGVREELRSDLAGAGSGKPSLPDSDRMRQIVMDIHRKWQSESKPAEGAAAGQNGGALGESRADIEFAETVMISATRQEPDAPTAARGNDEVTETVILTPSSDLKFPFGGEDRTGEAHVDQKQAESESCIDPDAEANLEETVMLVTEPGKVRQRGRGSS